jgi:hypothetical protein
MSVQSYIAKLRTKPEAVRKQIAFWSSFSVTLVIFLFWLSVITGVSDKFSNTIVSNVVDKAGTPAQSLLASAGSLFGDIKDLFFTPKKITYTSVEVRAGN